MWLSAVLLSLALLGSNAEGWKAIDALEDLINSYESSVMDIVRPVEETLQMSTSATTKILEELETKYIINDLYSIADSRKCKMTPIDFNYIKVNFKTELIKLQEPLGTRISDINTKLIDIKTSLGVYKGLANSKWWACKVEGKDCKEEIESWINEKLKLVKSMMVNNSKVKNVVKRDTSSSCALNQYKAQGYCYEIDRLTCNGVCETLDCFDEPSGDCTKYCVGGFHCRNLKCIENMKVCNGDDDCGDGSDESGCEEKREFTGNCTLEEGKFLCSDKKKCLDLSSACDGLSDCADGSDEAEACAGGECGAECKAAGGVCLRTPRGQICLSHCPPGTSETPRGCEAGPALPPHALADLLDDLPQMTSRYLASYKALVQRTHRVALATLSSMTDCHEDSLHRVFRLSGYNTERPHTTTRHPHTTTRHHTTTHHHTTTPPTTTSSSINNYYDY